MKIRVLLASLFVTSVGALPALAQVCPTEYDTYRDYDRRYETVTYVEASNPCAPYAWCGPRDAWGNPIYVIPVYTPVSDHGHYGYSTGAVRVNGWTGAVEHRGRNTYGDLIAY